MRRSPPRPSRRVAKRLPNLDTLQLQDGRSETGMELLLELLRRTAMQNQNEQLRPFYSIREVADHFTIPQTTVGRVYERLRSDGLLRTIWGSKTMLEPVAAIKGQETNTIGIAVDLSRFTNSLDYRRSILDLQRELWNRRTGERLLFFQDHGQEIIRVCKRYSASDMNTIIWLLPEVSNKRAILKLNSAGIRVICLAHVAISGIRDCYLIAPGRAIGKILRETVQGI